MVITKEQRRTMPPRSPRSAQTGADDLSVVLSHLATAFRTHDEAVVDSLAHLALDLGGSRADVADLVLAEIASVSATGGGLLARSDAEVRGRRALCRLSRPGAGASGRPVLVVTDAVDALTVAVHLVVEAAGARVAVALTPDPADAVALAHEQPWDRVVVDHAALRRSARRAQSLLAPLLSAPARPHVVVVTDDADAPDDRQSGTTWAPRSLRPVVRACGTFPDDPLTERERDVLRAVAAGRSNEQIGRQLQLSLSTVKTYLERIHAKLGSVDRASAVAIAVRGGWV